MPIKNKDGSIYRLSRPTPLNFDQVWFDKDKLVLHNFGSADTKPVEILSRPVAPIDPPASPPAPPDPDPVLAKEPAPAPMVEEPPRPKKLKNLLTAFCLPAERRVHKDDLYGDAFGRMAYGQKFTFQCVLLERNDFYIGFWAQVELGDGSIVYPYEYEDGQKLLDLRWYKVSGREDAEGGDGFTYEAMLSEVQPDFTA